MTSEEEGQDKHDLKCYLEQGDDSNLYGAEDTHNLQEEEHFLE